MLSKTQILFSITCAWIFSSLIAPDVFASPDCDRTFELEPDTVWRSRSPEAHTFRWRLPASGIATFDLLAADSSSRRLHLLRGACGESGAEISVIEQSPSRLVLAVWSAGHLFLTTQTEGAHFRVLTSFIEAEIVEEAFGSEDSGALAVRTSLLAAGPVDKAEPEIIDPDADGLRISGDRLLASFLALEEASVRKADPEIIDPDADGLTAPGNRYGSSPGFEQVLFFSPPCRLSGLDDHGDTAACSTPLILGRGLQGELENDWGDDHDVFSFDLLQVATVKISLVTEMAEMVFELSDASGQRLEEGLPWASDGAGLRRAATLAPGRYLLRVTGIPGDYVITATADD